jgi:hypothetical protein
VVEYGVDAIDASKVDDSMLGHSYFSNKRVLLQGSERSSDLWTWPGRSLRPDADPRRTHRYWQFDA